MSYRLIKTGVTMLSLSAVILVSSYYVSVFAAAASAGLFLFGWLNGIGDGILQW